MKCARGDLELLSLLEIMEGAEKRRKSGILTLARDEIRKTFYLLEGKVIFVTSTRPGERFGEFLAATGCLDLERMKQLVEDSRRRGVPFSGDLMEMKILDRNTLEGALRKLVVFSLAEALTWKTGTFEFTDRLPPSVLQGPVQIEVPQALGHAIRLIKARQVAVKDKQKGAMPDPPLPARS